MWRENKTILNSWLSIPSGFSAELMARQGWDSLVIDMQHGLIDYRAAVDMLTAISTTSVVPLVRVQWLEPGQIMSVLDAGALGVVCPMVNTAEDAERFVGCLRYPPRGQRSLGPIRASLVHGADYRRNATELVTGFAMIETRQALDNLDAILSVDGLDAVYIGPSDLALGLGVEPQRDPTNPVVVDAIAHILARAKHHGVRAGCHTGAVAQGLKMAKLGFDFVTVESDARLIEAAAAAAVTTFRQQSAKTP
jgi:4-hydroxy-2-oxoheptanedioate aldolase